MLTSAYLGTNALQVSWGICEVHNYSFSLSQETQISLAFKLCGPKGHTEKPRLIIGFEKFMKLDPNFKVRFCF